MQNNENFLEEFSGQGFDGVSQEHYKVPLLKILQNTSEQVMKGKPSYIEGAQAGMFFNTLTSEIYGEEIDLIPIRFQETWVEYEPNRGPFVAVHQPNDPNLVVDKSDYTNWKLPNGNQIVDTWNMYCVNAKKPQDGLMIIPFSKTAIKHCSNWLTQIRMLPLPGSDTKQAPFFGGVWTVKISLDSKKDNSWYNFGVGKTTTIKFKDYITVDLFGNWVKPSVTMLQNTTLQIDYNETKPESNNLLEENEDIDY